jgi:hypothetical protein
MTEMTIDDQTFRYDPEATAAIYARLRTGWAENCGCVGCRNLLAQRDEVYPSAFRDYSSGLALTGTRKRRPSRMARWTTGYTIMPAGSFLLVR